MRHQARPPEIVRGRLRAGALLLSLLVTLGLGPVGCATVGNNAGQALVPSKLHGRTGPFAVYTAKPLPPDASSVKALAALETDIAANLGVRAPDGVDPVEVYILKDRESFAHFLQFYYPELPPRRAFFLAQGPRRVVYTFENDRLDEDLRHEATHALLHLAVGDLPLWLDEGLAEYFENPDSRQGMNPEHLARLPDDLKAGWKPDLPRLETLKTVSEMSPRDYRESWAWVQYCLNGSPRAKTTLLAYLNEIRKSADTVPLSKRLESADPTGSAPMLAHLDRLRANPSLAQPRHESKILLQNAPVEPGDEHVRQAGVSVTSPPAPARRGFFSRLFGIFGKND